MLPYLEITHTESRCNVGLCLIKPNTLWKLFGLDVPSVMSTRVDGRKLTLGTSCRRERVKCDFCIFSGLLVFYNHLIGKMVAKPTSVGVLKVGHFQSFPFYLGLIFSLFIVMCSISNAIRM